MADDAALVARFLEGDQQALAEIYERYADRIYDLCRSILRSDDDAADAFQDTFLTASQKLGQLRNPSRLRPWLYSIARNQCRARIRMRRRTAPQADAGTAASVEVDMTAPLVQTELAALVAEARDGLNARDQEVLDLHMRHGLEGDDLAAVLGISTQSAYKLVQRVRGRVERSMGALLVARHGSRNCDELAAILGDSERAFGPVERKRISRHVDGCDTCDANRRRLLDPSGLASAMPMDPAPLAERARVEAALGEESLAAPSQRIRRWRRDGFPGRGPKPRRLLTFAGVGVVFLVAATAIALAIDVLPVDEPDMERADVSTRAPTSTTTAPPSSITTTTTVPTTTTRAPSTKLPPATTIPPTVTPTVTSPLPPPTPDPTVPNPPPVPEPTVPEPTVPEPTVPEPTVPDTTSPTITAFRMTPTFLWEVPSGAACGSPTASDAVVQASDAIGVTSVTLAWVGDAGASGSMALTESGSSWTGALSFPSGTFATVDFVTVSAIASDVAGNTTTSPTTFTLEVIPCP